MSARRATYFSFASRYTSFALQFVAVVVLSRLLTPVEVGIYSLSLAVVGLFQAFRDFGISTYVVQHKALDEKVLRSAYGVALATASAIAALLLLSAHPIAVFYDQPGVADVVRLLAVSLWLSAFMFPVRSMLAREMAFDRLFALNTVSGAANAFSSIAFAYYGFSYLSGALAMILATVCEIAFAGVAMRRLMFIRPRFRDWRPVLHFGGYSSLTTLITNFAMDAPDFVLGKTLGFDAVAFFSRANGLLNIFRQTVQSAIMPVALSAFSQEARASGDMRRHYLQATDLFLGVAWPFYGLAAILAPELIVVVFGEQWQAAAPVAQVLCLGAMVWAPAALSGQALLALGLVRSVFVREMLVQSARIAAVAAASFHSITAVAVALVGVYALGLAVTLHQLRGAIGLSVADLVRGLRKSAFVAVATVIVPLVIAAQPLATPSMTATLLISGSVGGVGWLLSLFLVRHPLGAEILVIRSQISDRLRGLSGASAVTSAPRNNAS